MSDVQKSVYDKFEVIPVQNNAVILQTITLPQGKWLLFGNAFITSDSDVATSYIVIGGDVDYSFAVAQAYKGQAIMGAAKTNVNIIQFINLNEAKPVYLWCVSDSNVSVYTPTLYALQVG